METGKSNEIRADPTHGLHAVGEVIRAMKPAWDEQRKQQIEKK